MIKVDKLRKAIDNLHGKIKEKEYTGGSSYEDIASGMISFLQTYASLIARDGEKEDSRQTLREYFNAVNNYLKILDNNPRVSRKETHGDIIGDSLNCAMPEVRNMTPYDANDLGFRSAKTAYIWSLGINARDLEEKLVA